MYKKILNVALFALLTGLLYSQEPVKRVLRIADTLTVQEKEAGNMVLLRSELDSLIRLYLASHPQKAVDEPIQNVTAKNELPLYMLIIGSVVLLAVAFFLYKLFKSQEKFRRTIYMLTRQVQHLEMSVTADQGDTGVGSKKNKSGANGMEKKIQVLTNQLETSMKEKKKCRNNWTAT